MTKLEKIGLIFTIIASILTILEYFGISFSKDSFLWLPNIVNSIIVWIYENIILIEFNIWVLLLVVYAVYKLNRFYQNKKTINTIGKEEKPKSLLEKFSEFDEDTKKVFGYIVYCQEKNIRCTKESINRKFRDTDISNLEQEKIIENLIEGNIVDPHYNMIDSTRYTFTKYGSDIAVAIVKKSKRSKND